MLIFLKGKSGLTNLTAFYNEVTDLVDGRKAVDVYLNFSKAVDTVSRSILKQTAEARAR